MDENFMDEGFPDSRRREIDHVYIVFNDLEKTEYLKIYTCKVYSNCYALGFEYSDMMGKIIKRNPTTSKGTFVARRHAVTYCLCKFLSIADRFSSDKRVIIIQHIEHLYAHKLPDTAD